jgi:hypothetical protein
MPIATLAVARFEEMFATKRPIDPRLPMSVLEQADRKSLQPVSAF